MALGVSCFYLFPIHDVPEGMELGGAAVLVVEVVGVFPDVEGEQGPQAAGDGVAGVGLLGDLQGAVLVGGEPDPAAAEEGDAAGFEFGLEGGEAPPLFVDLGGEGAGGCRRAARGELGKVEVMVEDLAGVVEEGAGGLADDLSQGQVFEAAAGEQLVEVVDVGLEVFAVVEGEGAFADDGFERVKGVG